MAIDLYDEENAAYLRTHLLWIYGKMAELTSVGLNVFGVTGLNQQGWIEYTQLKLTGFTPERERLTEYLLRVVRLPPHVVEYASDMLLNYDWLIEEITQDFKENHPCP